jgi:ferredoxin
MSYQVVMADSGTAFRCRPGQSVLEAMAAGGARCIPVGCRGGGCGVCRVQVMTGSYRLGRMSAAVISADEARGGLVLACQLYPLSDLRIVRVPRVSPRHETIRPQHDCAVPA